MENHEIINIIVIHKIIMLIFGLRHIMPYLFIFQITSYHNIELLVMFVISQVY